MDLFIGPFDCRQPPHDDALVAHSWRLPLDAWIGEGFGEGFGEAIDGGLSRSTSAPAGLRIGQFLATATPPHRALYLSLSTTRVLDNNRGTVEPLAHGVGWMLVEPQPPLDPRIERCLAEFRWRGARKSVDATYRIELTRTDSAWRATISRIEVPAGTHAPPREKRS
jgi:hypothetical protein